MEIQTYSHIIQGTPENATSPAGLSGDPLTSPNQVEQHSTAGVTLDISAAGRRVLTAQADGNRSDISGEEQAQDALQKIREASASAPGQFAGAQAHIVSQQVRSLLG